MSESVMVEDALDAALAMIDPRWGGRLRIVLTIRREARYWSDGVARIGYRDVARRARIEERYCLRLLKALCVERVLIRGELGAGSRGTAYRINPRPELWRGVPWLDDDRERRAYRISTPSRAPDRGASDEDAPRSHSAAPADPAPRSHVAAPGAAVIPLAPRSRARRGDEPGAATKDRGAVRRPLSISSQHPDRDGEQVLSRESREVVNRLVAAINARGNGKVFKGAAALLRRIEEVAASGHDLAELEAFIAQVDVKAGPPAVVGELEAFVVGELDAAPVVDRAAERRRLQGKAEALERLRDVYGDDWPAEMAAELDDLHRQLAACDTGGMEETG